MPTKVCKFDGGKYDGKPCRNRQCRFSHFFQPHPRQMFRQEVTKKQLRKERRKKKKKRKRLGIFFLGGGNEVFFPLWSISSHIGIQLD